MFVGVGEASFVALASPFIGALLSQPHASGIKNLSLLHTNTL